MALAPPYPSLGVLFVTPEVHPLSKTGGLGDVSAALPAALRELKVDARLLIPGYPQVLAGLKHKRKIAEFTAQPPFPSSRLLSAQLPSNASATFRYSSLIAPRSISRGGGPYADAAGHNWPDNALRFGLLSKIGAILASDASPLSWHPHIAHCNDWQSGLVPAYLHFHRGKKAASLMTIHNLAFQGVFPPETLTQLGLARRQLRYKWCLEYYGGMSFLKAGLYYSDHIATVSPTYAEEIQTAPLGFGMEGLLAGRRQHISGITNGIATTEWNPATDPHLTQNYTAGNLAAKAANKRALQQLLGLVVDPAHSVIRRCRALHLSEGLRSFIASSDAINRNTGPTGDSGQW